MRDLRKRVSVGLIFFALASPMAAASVDEILAKHVVARGGLEKWSSVESMKITGSFTAFSSTRPFTLYRQRPSLYYLDHMVGSDRIVYGYDDEIVWRIDPLYRMSWAVKAPEDVDVVTVLRDSEFATPFFDYKEKGQSVELVGLTTLEGNEVIELRLTRHDDKFLETPDGFVETWYLDPTTYLEVARYAETSEFGAPAAQSTFFGDFRSVDGVLIPHYIESEWRDRHRVMEIERIEINAEIDEAVFKRPIPEGMEKLQTLAGEWSVKEEQRLTPRHGTSEFQRTSTVVSSLNGAILQEHFTSGRIEMIRTLSYDYFKKCYRLTQINDFTSHLDVQEGVVEDGSLVFESQPAETTWEGFGTTVKERYKIYDILEDRFVWEQERTFDGGQRWFVSQRSTYTRKVDG